MKALVNHFLAVTISMSLPFTVRAADPTPEMRNAQGIFISKVELHEAPLLEAISFLREESIKSDPQKKGVNIAVAGKVDPDLRINMSVTDAAVSDILKVIAGQAGMKIESTDTILMLVPISR